MELRIKQIHNAGDIRSEFVELFVNSPVNLRHFILADTFYTQSDSDCRKNLFWFPELRVETGMSIRVNTRKGINNLHLNNFYWNLDEALWKNNFVSVYLVKIDEYLVFPDSKRFLDNLFSSD